MSWKTRWPRLGLILLVCATPLAAQRPKGKVAPPPPEPKSTIDVDFSLPFWTSYIERGVVLGDIPIMQPELAITIKSPHHSAVRLGILTTLELTKPSDSTKFGLADTLKRPNLVEAMPSLRMSQEFGPVTADIGGFYRMFPNKAGVTKASNYGGISAGFGFEHLPLPLHVEGVYEIGNVQGPRVEAEIMRPVEITHGAELVVGARAGWAFKQTASATAAPLMAKIAGDGFTNLDLVGGLNLVIAGARVRPRIEAIYGRDTSAVALATPTAKMYRWLGRFGASITLGGSFPKAPPPPPPAAAPAKRK